MRLHLYASLGGQQAVQKRWQQYKQLAKKSDE
jgi:hypothetical protein